MTKKSEKVVGSRGELAAEFCRIYGIKPVSLEYMDSNMPDGLIRAIKNAKFSVVNLDYFSQTIKNYPERIYNVAKHLAEELKADDVDKVSIDLLTAAQNVRIGFVTRQELDKHLKLEEQAFTAS